VRRLTEADADRVAELFALAFYDDPTWSWAFADPASRSDHLRAWWGLYARSIIPYGWSWTTDDGAAAALWVPPGEPELPPDDEERVEPLLRELLGERADAVLTLIERFEANHPHDPPHAYLSLLATYPSQRGRGVGMGLLAHNLALLDERAVPAYLESSNRANDHRYARLGFAEIGEFAAPGGQPTVGCMWRDPRGARAARERPVSS
jgi:GNAT superfamily N-acetyltransferase